MTDLAHKISASLATAGLVPGPAAGVIPASFLASGSGSESAPVPVRVSFNGREVRLGNMFRSGECKGEPVVEIGGAGKEGRRYVLMMVDPDAPTPEEPMYAFWRHWIVERRGNGGEGEVVVTRYLGPGPKDESGPHRYLFLLYEYEYEQEGAGAEKRQGVTGLRHGDAGGEEFVQRRSFDVGEFARRQGLRLVGMNWMRCVGDGWEGVVEM